MSYTDECLKELAARESQGVEAGDVAKALHKPSPVKFIPAPNWDHFPFPDPSQVMRDNIDTQYKQIEALNRRIEALSFVVGVIAALACVALVAVLS